jgi:hypothetical protein
VRVVVVHGLTSTATMLGILGPTGLKRPYVLLTMDDVWWEAAAELHLPRMFFRKKLAMMQYALGNHIVCVTTKDKQRETTSMHASFYAMDAVTMQLAYDEEV